MCNFLKKFIITKASSMTIASSVNQVPETLELKLVREEFTDISTIGSLYINSHFFCYTLEDKDRHLENAPANKIYGATCIPRGIYDVTISYSDRFKQVMPLVVNVPGFSGIRIHSGNVAADTLGCILVGGAKQPDKVTSSRLAFSQLFPQLKSAINLGHKITLDIV